MSLIEEALADFKSHEPGDNFSYTKNAAKHGVVLYESFGRGYQDEVGRWMKRR
jgi:hypothetical protein